jgi:hypothetical protein
MVPPDSFGLSRGPKYSGTDSTSLGFRVRGCHPVSPTFPGRSASFQTAFVVGPTTPHQKPDEVWPLPRSLAATDGISVDFSSSGYLDVSVPRVGSP